MALDDEIDDDFDIRSKNDAHFNEYVRGFNRCVENLEKQMVQLKKTYFRTGSDGKYEFIADKCIEEMSFKLQEHINKFDDVIEECEQIYMEQDTWL